MSNSFTKEERAHIRKKLIEKGFQRLKTGGIKAVNIEELTNSCYVAKGTFFNLFSNKSEYLYQMMREKRSQTKEKLQEYLDEEGKLTYEGLYQYLKWMCAENPNIFSYLTEQETKWLVSKWPVEYLENEDKDEDTAKWIMSFLKTPKQTPDWELFCNFLKLSAWALGSREFLLAHAFEPTIDTLIINACDSICEK
ncbi:MAG: TetR/AcrR family transcriptional regulator [Clostridiales bacterium]|nr:TetR/AcrR family transcriptional regulator [Clostridiales bacterium]